MKHLTWVTARYVIVLLMAVTTAQAVERTHDIVPEDYFTEVFLEGCAGSLDGSMTAYVDYRWDIPNDGRSNDIWVVDNKTQQTRRLTFDPGNETNPQWAPDESWIYFVGH